MAVIDWWNLPLILVVFFFALCLLLLARSIAGITCSACHSSGTFFSMWHTHTHTHFSFFYSVTLAVIDGWNGSLCSCSVFLCNVLAATWRIAGIACRACCSSGTFFSLWHTHTHACARARTHTHTRARAHTHTHTHCACWMGCFRLFHVGHDHGLVRCIVFAHVFVNVPVWSPQYYLWYFSMNNHSFVHFLAHHPTSSF